MSKSDLAEIMRSIREDRPCDKHVCGHVKTKENCQTCKKCVQWRKWFKKSWDALQKYYGVD